MCSSKYNCNYVHTYHTILIFYNNLHALLENKKIIELLIKHGYVNINTPNAIGKTPLFQALSIGSEPIAELLIEHGANITITDRNSKTPLHLTAQYGKINSNLIAKFQTQN